jgi:hypothetical protein
MFRRWAEARMYRKTVQLAVSELRRAARTPNALEKLEALETAEQKLKDALWLCPEESKERFEAGLAEIQRSRDRSLKQALPAVERLLDAAESGVGYPDAILQPAGRLLAILNHYLPDDAQVDLLSSRLRQLGGKQPPYRPVAPLAEMYHRPEGGAGCGALIGGVVLLLLLTAFSLLTITP